MSGSKEIKRLPIGPGIHQYILLDESLPEAGPLSQWSSRVVCDGGSSDPLNVPSHWHKYHDEYMRVIEGRLEVTLEGKTFVVTPSDGQVKIPKGQAHSLKSFKGERMVFEERTAPPGDYKAKFFNDLLSQPLDENFNGSFWHTMRAFYDGDAYPDLGLHFRFFDVAFITLVGGIAKLVLPENKLKLQ
ncbi:hypothetical protein LA080_007402 [Diaporthe eres]|uniref:Cupin type-2 domain-containing protein n=2 Tax=Diaporthe eres species complex TaxID=2972384 RepID=A0ABR4DWY7_9PEZI|nr:hypothetical protein LA080_007402 [Diaporthe eres]